MRFSAKKEILQKAIQITEGVVNPRTTLPILANILIETNGKEKIKFAATDLDIGVIYNMPTNVQEEGAITVPAKKLFDIIRELPDGEITITAKKNNAVTIECEKSFFKLIGLPKEDFPNLPSLEDIEKIEIEQAVLKEMLKKTGFAISRDETRYILNGTLINIKSGKIRVVATDGRRLAMIEKPVSLNKDIKKQVIVPVKTVNELARILNDAGNVKIGFGENQIMFEINETTITTRIIEGEYPNYEQVIPKESAEKILINRERFLSSAKRAGLFTSPDSQSIKIDLFKNKMIISKSAPDVGEVKEELDVSYNGAELTVGFNPNYIIDVLKNMEQGEITFEMTNAEKPGVVRDGSGYIYIVLPMQLV